jgi:adenylate kinase family enzyme
VQAVSLLLREELRAHPRIVVVGTSGSGKTTFASSLANVLGYEHVELDTLFWGPSWTPRATFSELVDAAMAKEHWVMDGNFSRVRDKLWQRATAIVWLNHSFLTVYGRALQRTLQRVLRREEVYAGNRETFRNAFLARDGIAWIPILTYQRRRREYRALFNEPRFQHLRVVELRKPAQAAALLAR